MSQDKYEMDDGETFVPTLLKENLILFLFKKRYCSLFTLFSIIRFTIQLRWKFNIWKQNLNFHAEKSDVPRFCLRHVTICPKARIKGEIFYALQRSTRLLAELGLYINHVTYLIMTLSIFFKQQLRHYIEIISIPYEMLFFRKN